MLKRQIGEKLKISEYRHIKESGIRKQNYQKNYDI